MVSICTRSCGWGGRRALNLRIVWLGMVAVLMAGTGWVRADGELSQEEIRVALQKLAAARPAGGVIVEFRETRRLPLLDKPVVATGAIEFLPPHFFRKTVKGSFPSITTVNGKDLWIYYPSEAAAEKYSLERNRPLRESLEALAAGFDPGRILGNFEITGYRTEGSLDLRLVPRRRALRNSLSTLNLQFNFSGGLDRIVLSEPGGGSTHIEVLSEKPAALSPADFEFVPPPGTSVSQPLAGCRIYKSQPLLC